MNNSFILALGLAAIDGLTSAFVAMLILALAVIGSGQQGGSDTSTETALLNITRPRLNLLVRVSPDCGGQGALRAPIIGGKSERLEEIESFTKQGSVYWIEACNATDEVCSSQLIVNNGLPDRPWCIDLAIGNTPLNFTDGPTKPINVTLTLVNGTESPPLEDKGWKIDGCWHSYEFSPKVAGLRTRGVRC